MRGNAHWVPGKLLSDQTRMNAPDLALSQRASPTDALPHGGWCGFNRRTTTDKIEEVDSILPASWQRNPAAALQPIQELQVFERVTPWC